MAFSLVAHTSMHGSGTASTSLDTTGCALLIVCVADEGGSTPVVSDSKSNVWHQVGVAGTRKAYLFIAQNTAVVGSGHTFTVTGNYPSAAVLAYSCTSPILNAWSGALGSATTLQPGSLTPSANGALFVTVFNTFGNGVTASIDASFTLEEEIAETGAYDGVHAADFIQGTAGALNPTWTSSSANAAYAAMMAAFIEGGGSGGGGGATAYAFAG